MIQELIMSVLMNPAIQAILMGFVLTAVSWVVKKSSDEKTQRYWTGIQAAAISAFNIAETVIPDDVENKTLKKINKALSEFNNNVSNRFDRNATQSEIDIAQDLWAELALELKKKLN